MFQSTFRVMNKWHETPTSGENFAFMRHDVFDSRVPLDGMKEKGH